MEFMKAEKNMTVQDLIDELMLVKDKSKEIRVVVNTNDYITSYPASLFDMSIKEGEDIAKDHFDNIITIESMSMYLIFNILCFAKYIL